MTKWPSGPWRVDINQLGRHIRNNDRVIFTAPRVTYFEGQPERYENDLAAQHAALNLGAAAPDLYAATDWVDNIKGFTSCYEYVPVAAVKDEEKFRITLSGAEIRALIDARRKARGE